MSVSFSRSKTCLGITASHTAEHLRKKLNQCKSIPAINSADATFNCFCYEMKWKRKSMICEG